MFLLIACTGTPDPHLEDTSVAIEPSPYIVDEVDEVEPNLGADEVGLAAEEALAVMLELDASPPLLGYEAAMLAQDEDCPNYYSDGENTYWYDYCTSESGGYFSGYGFGYAYVDYEVDGYLYNGDAVYAVAEIATPEGYTYEAGGSAQLLQAVYVGEDNIPHTYASSVFNGTFSFDGPEAQDTWLDSELAPTATLIAYEIPENEVYPTYNGRILAIDGGVNGLGGISDTVVMEVQVIPEGLGGSCPEELHGTVSVRDDEGLWYDLVFDSPEAWSEEVMDPADCDGCGQVYFRGEALGQACIGDVSALLDWGEGASPWM